MNILYLKMFIEYHIQCTILFYIITEHVKNSNIIGHFSYKLCP